MSFSLKIVRGVSCLADELCRLWYLRRFGDVSTIIFMMKTAEISIQTHQGMECKTDLNES